MARKCELKKTHFFIRRGREQPFAGEKSGGVWGEEKKYVETSKSESHAKDLHAR